MNQRTRILIAVVILMLLAGAVLGVDYLRRQPAAAAGTVRTPQPGSRTGMGTPAAASVAPGSIPIYLDQALIGSLGPNDLNPLPMASFVDAEQGKQQSGWLLRDALLVRIARQDLAPATVIVVSSSVQKKSAQVTWAEADNPDNKILLTLANRGTLKLVSTLPSLSTRNDWVQDVDRIDVKTK